MMKWASIIILAIVLAVSLAACDSEETEDADTPNTEAVNTSQPQPSSTPDTRITELETKLLAIEGIYIVDMIEVYDTTPPDDILFSYEIFVEPGYETEAMAQQIMDVSTTHWEQYIDDPENIEWSFSFALWDGNGPSIVYSCCGSPGFETGLVREEINITPIVTNTPE